MARQLCDRFPIDRPFGDVQQLLTEAQPEVVHITTPPQSHFELGRICLEAGCHLYVEKPFMLNASEAEELLALAERKHRRVTVGHDDQFSHVTRRMRRFVSEGYLGGPPIHLESSYCYDLGDPRYAKALLGDKRHWVRRLPGKLLQNIISHGIARLAEFLPEDEVEVTAAAFVSPMLRSLNELEMQDELRVMLRSGDCTGYFTFSSQMRPVLHQFRLYGPRNGLLLDEDQQTLIRLKGQRHKSYAEKFLPPFELARQYVGNVRLNLRAFLARDFHMKSGMKYLIESFYGSIQQGTPVPIPYREILLTMQIMDAIFDQVGSRGVSGDESDHVPRRAVTV